MHRADRGKSVVRYFEGEEGIRSLRATLAETRTKQFDTFARLHEQLEAVARTDEDERFHIIKPLARYRLIYVPDPGVSIPRFPENVMGRVEIRYANQIPFDFEGEVGILDSISYVASFHPRVHVSVIESEPIAALMRAQFELVWKNASSERVNVSSQSRDASSFI
jgi:hypothetical protein